eukprot:8721506-Pyramimonas_sp.AAC.1
MKVGANPKIFPQLGLISAIRDHERGMCTASAYAKYAMPYSVVCFAALFSLCLPAFLSVYVQIAFYNESVRSPLQALANLERATAATQTQSGNIRASQDAHLELVQTR